LGGRYVDQLVNGIANESKVGYQSLTPGIQLQVMKDVELMQTQQVEGAVWNFYRSPVTGKIGPSGPLSDFLIQNNIPVVLHY
jgi:filamentous hemagglutinin